jgi:glucose/arabinose dehydrogenase
LKSIGYIILLASLSIIIYAVLNSIQIGISWAANDNTKVQHFGCVDYTTTFHCDPLHNKLVGYGYSGSSIIIHNLADIKPIFVDGKYDKALEIIAPYREAVHIPSLSNITLKDFSVSFWVKGVEQAEPVGQIVSYTNSRHTAGWFFDMSLGQGSSNQLVRFVFTDNSGKLILSPDVPIQPGMFHQITGTFNGSLIRIYNDGQLMGETKYQGSYSGDAGLPLTIGSAAYCASCNRWTGIIDDLRIYGKTLGPDQVKEIFNNQEGRNLPILLAHWKFDGQFDDASGNNNHGTLSTLLASMAYSKDGRMFYTEKNSGNIRIMQNNTILETPFATLSDVYINWEQGLLGLTLDSDFAHNHYVYLYYTAEDSNGNPLNRVVRFTEDNNKGKDIKILIDNIPASKGYHSGGALAFGPDDKLYITVGDATEHPFAQDPSILIGKVLRINRDGSIPSDNPFPNSPVYTLGHRNMYGIAFDKYGNGLVSENGDYYYDEINLIQKGGNYGFPTFQPPNRAPELSNSSEAILPLRSYWDTIAPTQMIYYQGDKIPFLKDKFVVGSYSGDLYILQLDRASKQIVQEYRIDLENYPFKPVVGLSESPNGDLYFGAYAIFKLNATNIHPKKQYLFPLEINSSSSVNIEGIQFDPKGAKMTMDLNNQANATDLKSTSPTPSSTLLKLEIPKALLNDVVGVINSDAHKQLQFTSTNSTSPDYNVFSIQVPNVPHLEIIVIGSTLEMPGEQVLTG